MKVLVSILAVAAIAIAVSVAPASDVQVLSNDQLGSFVGACCEPATPQSGDPYCKDECFDWGETSKQYSDPLDEQTRLCTASADLNDECVNDHWINCGTSSDLREYHVWYGNDDCDGAYNDTIDSYGVVLPRANGDSCGD